VAVLRSDAADEILQRITRAARPNHDGAVVHRLNSIASMGPKGSPQRSQHPRLAVQ
jgi:DNA integrity scanning protein DisA with diadenylate cyclase activity